MIWTIEDLKSFAAAKCLDLYLNLPEEDLLHLPAHVGQCWHTGEQIYIASQQSVKADAEPACVCTKVCENNECKLFINNNCTCKDRTA